MLCETYLEGSMSQTNEKSLYIVRVGNDDMNGYLEAYYCTLQGIKRIKTRLLRTWEMVSPYGCVDDTGTYIAYLFGLKDGDMTSLVNPDIIKWGNVPASVRKGYESAFQKNEGMWEQRVYLESNHE